MPGDGVDVLGRRIKDRLGVTGDIGVVVIGPDLSAQTSGLQSRANIVLDERSRLIGIDIHGRVRGLAI